MRAIIMGAGDRPGVREAYSNLKSEMEKYVKIVDVDFEWSKDMSQVESEIAIVFGGDGSVLRSAHQMQSRQRPVLAVNFGTLGFLANIRAENLIEVLENLNPGNIPTIRHLMLQCEIWNGKSGNISETCYCLNEVLAYNEFEGFRMVNIALTVDNEPVTTFRCDGLILSTPIGSTGHSLSAGGPILRKDIDAVVISPVNPHSLSQRPVVDSADRTYEIRFVNTGGKVIIDGMELFHVKSEDRVIVRRADVSFRMISLPDYGYYATLRDKLGWTGQIPKIASESSVD